MELKIIPEKNGCRYLLCDAHGNYFELNKTAYDMLTTYQQTHNYDSVLSHLRKTYPEINITKSDIETKIKSILLDISQKRKTSYLHKLFTILKPGSGLFLYSNLKVLFHPAVFLTLLTIGIASSFIYYSQIQPISVTENFSFTQIPIYYILFLLILFFHEVGHATAAFRYGVRPRDIGFGIYFIFPVLYTNVTAAWELNASKRIVVNMGGIYFQLLVNLLLIAFAQSGILTATVQALFLINSLSIVASLIPFLRYDGYWIVSDLCRIPNLKKRASDLVTHIVAKPKQIKEYFLENKIPVSLTIYTALYASFWGGLYLYMGHFIMASLTSISDNYLSDNPHNATLIAEKLLVLSFISITIILAFCRFIKSIYHAKTK